ncbi:polysaccharide deacetylase family protein [Tessaracoccus antarcticus]|uniref:polysaccharide deacetylase family protein n=1 Tax=Tessaracoccus antarcticus TaxID=2479848 RepID=UPI0018F31F34|nr:polysaccharide deacetylase family protein [Tessaracoccus antarcticus]
MSRRVRLISGWVAIALGVALLLGVGVYKLSNSRRIQVVGELIQRVATTDKVVALTFDDGPTPGDTEAVLQTLAERKVMATFFLCGASMHDHPAQTKEIVAAGHQVGNHSWSHRRMWFMTPTEVRRELDDTDEMIRDSGYQGRIDFRPPYGKKLLVLPWILRERGTRTITWDVSPEDFSGVEQTPEQLRDIVLDTVRPGSIILLHPMNGRTRTQEATALIIDSLTQEGYRFVTVAELTN